MDLSTSSCPILRAALRTRWHALSGRWSQRRLGVPVIVEDRPGASSIIGMEACAKAKSDGQTLCLTVADSLSYNPQFSPSCHTIRTRASRRWSGWHGPIILLVANAKAPFNNYKEMIAYAKANPGKLNWGTWGPATLPDLYLRWIASNAGVDITAIPYGGAGKSKYRRLFRRGRHHLHGIRRGGAANQGRQDQAFVTIGDKRSPFMPESADRLAKRAAIPDLRAILESCSRRGRRSRSSIGSTPNSLRQLPIRRCRNFTGSRRWCGNRTHPSSSPPSPRLTVRPQPKSSRASASSHKMPCRNRKKLMVDIHDLYPASSATSIWRRRTRRWTRS